MKPEYLNFLCCPDCQGDLELSVSQQLDDRIQEGALGCSACQTSFPIRGFIPRFVEHDSYAKSFGAQWNAFATSQIDNSEHQESELRFRSEIGWSNDELSGKTIVEFGSGAGRFVEVASRSAALAVGLDITDAVDASQKNLGHRDNVFFIQSDIFQPPVKPQFFDFAYSIGVIHHTPEPEQAFGKMVDCVTDQGSVALSLYDISLYRRPNRNNLVVATKDLLWALNSWRCELFRQVTTRVPHGMMIAYCKTVIPVLHYLNRIPIVGLIRYLFPSTCYRHLPVINSMVDTMDTYSTKIVHQYRSKDLFQWFLRRGLKQITVMNSRAGWVSVNANVGDEASREKNRRVLRQPDMPGKTNFVD